MNEELKKSINELQSTTKGMGLSQSLAYLAKAFPGKVTLSSSFSWEDQVLSFYVLDGKLDIEIFTLDTGRLFPETYTVWSKTNDRYQTQIKAYYPNQGEVEKYVNEKGPNAFYNSVADRKGCCFIRKVEPLKRALKNKSIWITGLRAEHSPERQDLQTFEWDEGNSIIKFNPLLHVATDELKKIINDHSIPYNPLHDKGFVSIGCAPCTRAIQPGEDFRAGRWWWEDNSKKECGLHAR
ncbi:MAG TPA: phosphoadenylyl-sulfate reductase [Cyclobacteriaceae bacterium]|jgi:phosphoadenosine phosphosulfate reductase|nr:phosphoadenylyl-sulfate reductase [Cyclobacteriaceae bacterium]